MEYTSLKTNYEPTELNFYFGERFDRFHSWFDLQLLANKVRRVQLFNGSSIELNNGQLVTSINFLASRWKWNERTVQQFLEYLKKEQLVKLDSNNRRTIITVNYINQLSGE